RAESADYSVESWNESGMQGSGASRSASRHSSPTTRPGQHREIGMKSRNFEELRRMPYRGGTIVEDKNIAITHADYIRLQRLVESSRQFRHRDAKHLDDLEQELERAAIMKPGEVPSDVVTMNSRVKVKDGGTLQLLLKVVEMLRI